MDQNLGPRTGACTNHDSGPPRESVLSSGSNEAGLNAYLLPVIPQVALDTISAAFEIDVVRPSVPAVTVGATGDSILIFEEDPSLRYLLALVLTSEEFIPFPCDSLLAVEALLALRRPDAAVFDLPWDRNDGASVAALLRALRIPMILMSAWGAEDARLTARTWGADGFIPEPFEPQALVQCLRNLVAKSQAQGANSAELKILGHS